MFKQRRVKCHDGRTQWIFRNPEDAFPLQLTGFKAGIKADLKALQEVAATLSGEYVQQLQGLLYSLDNQNQSLMMSFRTYYIVYAANPSQTTHERLEARCDALIQRQQALTDARIHLQSLIQLAQSGRDAEYSELFRAIVDRVGGRSFAGAVAARLEIRESREIADDWIERGSHAS